MTAALLPAPLCSSCIQFQDLVGFVLRLEQACRGLSPPGTLAAGIGFYLLGVLQKYGNAVESVALAPDTVSKSLCTNLTCAMCVCVCMFFRMESNSE